MNQTSTQVPSSDWWPCVQASIVAATPVTELPAFDRRTPLEVRVGAVALLGGQPDHIWETAAHDVPAVAAKVARRAELPDSVAAILVRRTERHVSTAVAANRNVSYEHLDQLLQAQFRPSHQTSPVPDTIAANPAWGAVALRDPLTSSNPLRELLARALPDDLLDHSAAARVAVQIVTNPAMPAASLHAVAANLFDGGVGDLHNGPLIAHQLAQNPNVSGATIQLLWEATFGSEQLLEHPNCPVELLTDALTQKPARRNAARNPNAPADLVDELVNASSVFAAANPALTGDQIRRLRSNATGEQLARIDTLLGSNPATSYELRAELAAQGVASAAAQLAAEGRWAGARHLAAKSVDGRKAIVRDGPAISSDNVDALCALAVANPQHTYGELVETAQLI